VYSDHRLRILVELVMVKGALELLLVLAGLVVL